MANEILERECKKGREKIRALLDGAAKDERYAAAADEFNNRTRDKIASLKHQKAALEDFLRHANPRGLEPDGSPARTPSRIIRLLDQWGRRSSPYVEGAKIIAEEALREIERALREERSTLDQANANAAEWATEARRKRAEARELTAYYRSVGCNI